MLLTKTRLALMISLSYAPFFASAVDVNGSTAEVADNQETSHYDVLNSGALSVVGGRIGSATVTGSSFSVTDSGTVTGLNSSSGIAIDSDNSTVTINNGVVNSEAESGIRAENTILSIDGSQIINNGTFALNILGSGSSVIKNSSISLNGNVGEAITYDDSLNNSITGSSISSAGFGISYLNSSGSIEDASIDASQDGLIIQSVRSMNSVPATPSTLNLSGSSINSGGSGIVVINSTVNIDSTTVNATGEAGNGINIYDDFQGGNMPSSISLSNSKVTGTNNGIRIAPYATTNPTSANITIDNSSIEGVTGAAIAVSNMDAQVQIKNNSLLKGNNDALVSNTTGGNIDMTIDGSILTGNIVTDTTSTTNLVLQNNAGITGSISNVNTLTIGSNSGWSLTQSDRVGAVSLNGGIVNFGSSAGQYRTLTVASLAGNGTFFMNTDLATNNGDLLNINGLATGSHLLSVKNSGNEPAEGNSDYRIVHTGSGDAQFNVSGGKVDAGVWQYSLQKRGTDWYLTQDPSDAGGGSDIGGGNGAEGGSNNNGGGKTTSLSTDAVISMATAPIYIFNNELQNLRYRRGEITSLSSLEGGMWGHYLGGENHIDGSYGSSYHLKQNGIEIGGDKIIDTEGGKLAVGVFASFSDNTVDHTRGGSSKVGSTSTGLYASWFHNSGIYVDALAKYNRFKNQLDTNMSDGTPVNADYKQNGYGGSLEAGWSLSPSESMWIEPYLRTTIFRGDSKNITLSNGMKSEIDTAKSLQGELGINAGVNIDVSGNELRPYIKAAAVHEFEDSNIVRVNDIVSFNNDISGTAGKYGAGISSTISKNAAVWVEANYLKGDHVESPVSATAGFRLSF